MPKPMTVKEAITFFRAMADVLEQQGDVQSAEAARTLLTAYDASQTVVQAVEEWTHGHLSSDDLDQYLHAYQQRKLT